MAEEHNQRLGVDPLLKMNWHLEIDGVVIAGFKTCNELEREFSMAKHRNGNDPPRHKKQRTVEEIKPLTFTEGYTTDNHAMEKWYQEGDRKSVSLIGLDHLQNEAARYNLIQAFPSIYKLGDWDSENDGDVQIREMTIEMEDWSNDNAAGYTF